MEEQTTLLAPWMTFVFDSLESHLKTYESPLFEILPHPTPDRGKCGNHEATKTHRHHFCLFLCCAKDISRYCLESVAFRGAIDGDGELATSRGINSGDDSGKLRSIGAADNDAVTAGVNGDCGGRESRCKTHPSPGSNDVTITNARVNFSAKKDNVTNHSSGCNGVDITNAIDNSSTLKHNSSTLRLAHPSTTPSLLPSQLSRLSLLVQPEDYRSWNILKRGSNSSLELKFAYFVLTKHPRSTEIFCHLRYLSNKISRDAKDNFAAKMALCRQGFAKCEEAAARYHGNYHAWDHRRFLASLLVNSPTDDDDDDDFNDSKDTNPNDDTIAALLQKELNDVKQFQSTRVSDACPFKYRLFLVEMRSNAGLKGVHFEFLEELAELNRLMSVYPGHESLWNYRRDLIRLARKEDESNFDLLSREDAAFLASVEMKCKNDWEITLQDRYRSQVARA